MSRTKKGIGLIVIALALVALVAAGIFFPQAESGGGTVVSGDGATAVAAANMNIGDNGYDYQVYTDISSPGEVSDRVTQGTAVSDANGLSNALSGGGQYYLTRDITMDAMTALGTSAVDGVFSGTLYGNGYTVTIAVASRSTYPWSAGGDYGFLVKRLTGTIRDVNVVITGASGSWTYFGPSIEGANASGTMTKNIGGIAGSLDGGVIYNCSVTFRDRFAFSNGADVPGVARAWSTVNVNALFGGVAGWSNGGMIANTEVNYDGAVVNSGSKIAYTDYWMLVATGGLVGQTDGGLTLNKVTVQGAGYLAGDAALISNSTSGGAVDEYTGGLVGFAHGGVTVNGAYINLTYLTNSGDNNPWGSGYMISESGVWSGGIRSYWSVDSGMYGWNGSMWGGMGFKSLCDSIVNDNTGNYTNSTVGEGYMMRTSYGIGAAETAGIGGVSLNNIYVSEATADIIKKTHPWALNEVDSQYQDQMEQGKGNAYWYRYQWVYSVVPNGSDATFAKAGGISSTASGAGISNNANNDRALYIRYSGQSEDRFVYSVTQGNDVFNVAARTYDKSGNVYVPVMYTGYNTAQSGNIYMVKEDAGKMGLGDDGNAVDPTNYPNLWDKMLPRASYTIEAAYGSWLYIDYDMSRAYNDPTTSQRSDAYSGSGSVYTYTYNGDYMYVPAFAGYNASYTGRTESFSATELDSALGGSSNITLRSTSTVTDSGERTYSQSNYRYEGAGNAGSYVMSFTAPSGNRFISKNGNYYYLSFKDDYTVNITVAPRELTVNWNGADSLVYNGAAQQPTYSLGNVATGSQLGNNDAQSLSSTVSYSAAQGLLNPAGLPLHAGSYTATVQANHTNASLLNNYSLQSGGTRQFSVAAAEVSLSIPDRTSVYGDAINTSEMAAYIVADEFFGDDAEFFTLAVSTTANFRSPVGDYVLTLTASVREDAPSTAATDYTFAPSSGKLTVTARPINGSLELVQGVYNGSAYDSALTLAQGVLVQGDDSAFTLTYAPEEGDVVTSPVDAGTYTVGITPAPNYTLGTVTVGDEMFAAGTVTVTIERRQADVTLDLADSYVYDGQSKVEGYTIEEASDGDTGVIASDTGSVTAQLSYSVGAESREPILPGNYIASAQAGGDRGGNYVLTVVNGDFEITRAQLEVLFSEEPYVYDGQEKNVVYTLIGVGGAQADDSLIGSVSVTYNNAQAVPTDAGVYDVQITVAEGSAYAEARFETTMNVDRADVTIAPTLNSGDAYVTEYTGTAQAPQFTLSAAGMDPDDFMSQVTASYEKDGEAAPAVVNAGQYTVTLTFGQTTNYNGAQAVYTWTVDRLTPSVSFDELAEYVYDGGVQTPAYGVEGAVDTTYGAPEIVVKNSDGEPVEGGASDAGTYTVTVSFAESVNYNAFSGSIEFTIDPFALQFVGDTEQYVSLIGGDTPELTVSSYLASVNAALRGAGGEYLDDGDMGVKFYAIGDTSQEITEFVYDGGSESGFDAVFSYEGGSGNYTFDPVTVTVYVVGAEIIIEVTYGGSPLVASQGSAETVYEFGSMLAATATATYGDAPVEETELSYVWEKLGEDGAYAETDSLKGAGSFRVVYTLSHEDVTMNSVVYVTVSPKAVTVDAEDADVIYGDALDTSSLGKGVEIGDGVTVDLTVTSSADRFASAGLHGGALSGVVVQMHGDDLANYTVTVNAGDLTVTPREVWLKANDVQAVYGDAVVFAGFGVYTSADATELWADYASASAISATLSVQTGKLSVGGYDIAVSASANDNYTICNAGTSGRLNVTERPITLSVGNISVVYGSADLTGMTGGAYSLSGGTLASGDRLSVNFSLAADIASLDAGGYMLSDYVAVEALITDGEDVTSNYDITVKDGGLTVTPRRITVSVTGWSDGSQTVEGSELVYSAGDWEPIYSFEGVVGERVPEIVGSDGTAVTVRNAGDWSIELALGAGETNYTLAAVTVRVTVAPYKTVFTGADSAEYTYGDEISEITPQIVTLDGDSADGAVNVVWREGSATGAEIAFGDIENAGVYYAIITYGGTNYSADRAVCTVTIGKKTVTCADLGTAVQSIERTYFASNVSVTVDQLFESTSEIFSALEGSLSVVFYDVEGGSLSAVRNAGEYTVNAVLGDHRNYTADGDLFGTGVTLSVAKASGDELSTYPPLDSGMTLTYSGADLSAALADTVHVLGINSETVDASKSFAYVPSAGGDTAYEVTEAGAYSVTVTLSDMANYEDRDIVFSLTVQRLTFDVGAVGFADSEVTYDADGHTIEASGIAGNAEAVVYDVVYKYTDEGALPVEDAVAAGVYTVEMTVYIDRNNGAHNGGSAVTEGMWTDADGTEHEAYVYTMTATLTIGTASPSLAVDPDEDMAFHYTGAGHDLTVGITSADGVNYTYGPEAVGKKVVLDGLGTFVFYYEDTDGNRVTDGAGLDISPIDAGSYIFCAEFTSSDPNYADKEYRFDDDKQYLIILPLYVTVDYDRLAVEYGVLPDDWQSVQDYVAANFGYDYSIDDLYLDETIDLSEMFDVYVNVDANGTFDAAGRVFVDTSVEVGDAYRRNITVVENGALYLEITEAPVTDAMIEGLFPDVRVVYDHGMSVTADDLWEAAQTVEGAFGETVGYTVSLNGAADWAAVSAGVYDLTVTVDSANYTARDIAVTLTVDPKPVYAVYSIDGIQAEDGVLETVFNTLPREVSVDTRDEYVTATAQYRVGDALLVSAPTDVGEYTVSALLSDNTNYRLAAGHESVTLTVREGSIDEIVATWVSDSEGEYGSAGVDLSRIPSGYSAQVSYTDGQGGAVTDIRRAGVGVYSAVVTVSGNNATGTARVVYTVVPFEVTVTVSAATDEGRAPTIADATASADRTLPAGDTVSVTGLTATGQYDLSLEKGYYDLGDWFTASVAFSSSDDNYDCTVVMGDLTVMPENAPQIVSVTASSGSVTFTLAEEGLYSYRINGGRWQNVSGATASFTVESLRAQTEYTFDIAWQEYRQKYDTVQTATTADPAVLKSRIDAMLEDGLTEDEIAQYDEITALYNALNDADKETVRGSYEQYAAACSSEGGSNAADVVAIVSVVIAAVAAVGTAVFVTVRKRRQKAEDGDDDGSDGSDDGEKGGRDEASDDKDAEQEGDDGGQDKE